MIHMYIVNDYYNNVWPLGQGRIPRVGNGNTLHYSLPGKFHGQQSLAGYSLWCWKELNMIKPNEHSKVNFNTSITSGNYHCVDIC